MKTYIAKPQHLLRHLGIYSIGLENTLKFFLSTEPRKDQIAVL